MIMIDDWHPDVIEFIFSKNRESDIEKIRDKWQSKFPNANFKAHNIDNANISVCISDKFMKAVKEDATWDLMFPDYESISKEIYDSEWDGNIHKWIEKGYPVKVYDTIRARDLWDCLMESAWMSAEPGVVFMERYNRESNTWYFNHIVSTNPCGEQGLPSWGVCVTGDTVVATPDGVRRVDSLVSKGSGYVFSTDNKMRKYLDVVYNGKKDVYRVKVNGGISIKATDDHLIFADGKMRKTKDLKVGMQVKLLNEFPYVKYSGDAFYEMLGWMHGDGWYSGKVVGIGFNYKDGDGEAKDKLLPVFHETFGTADREPLRDDEIGYAVQTETKHALSVAESLGMVASRHREIELPTTFYEWDINAQISFMRGLFTADGTVSGKNLAQIALYSSSLTLLEQTQQFLASIGISSSVYTTEFKTVKRNPQHRLFITNESSVRFMDIIGFVTEEKNSRYCPSKFRDKARRIVSVEYVGKEDVYDIVEVEGTNEFYGNGIATHNCLLGHINLSRFTKGPIGKAEVDWEGIRRAARSGVRFLDDVIDYTKYYFDENEKNQKNERRVGMGTLGLGEMLIRLGKKYGPESEEFIDELYRFIAVEAYKMSIEIAKEKGAFPAFEYDKFIQSGFMKRMLPELPEEYQQMLKETGIRNCTLLTQAPTGSTGTMIGTSTGIEPFYDWTYWRSGRLGTKLVEEAIVREYFDENPHLVDGEYDPSKVRDYLPDYFVTAMDLSPEGHVRVQAAVQKWVDSSISKTSNVPSHYTVEQVKELYELGYEMGLKGITVYRDGSRDQQVLSSASEEPQEVPQEAPADTGPRKRPSRVAGHTEKIGLPDATKLYVTVNSVDDTPIEVFIQGGEGDDEISALCTYAGRLISTALKFGVPAEQLVKQGLKVAGGKPFFYRADFEEKGRLIKNIPSAVSHVMSRYLDSEQSRVVEESVTSGEKCPCGGTLRFAEGCSTCTKCGNSKCS